MQKLNVHRVINYLNKFIYTASLQYVSLYPFFPFLIHQKYHIIIEEEPEQDEDDNTTVITKCIQSVKSHLNEPFIQAFQTILAFIAMMARKMAAAAIFGNVTLFFLFLISSLYQRNSSQNRSNRL